MGFVEVYLSDEDKFKVLLLAFALFLLSLLGSICLAVSFCPLNKWLLERSARKRRQQLFYQQHQQQIITQSSTPVYLLTGGPGAAGKLARAPSAVLLHGSRARSQQQQLRQASNVSYGGPPPAYEAALRATRLQSLTGTLPQMYVDEQKAGSEWPAQMVDRDLDLGDYFHQPKELTSLEGPLPAALPHIQISPGEPLPPPSASQDPQQQQQPGCWPKQQAPIMLRLWVKMMEPGELVERARGSQQREPPSPSLGRMSLSRQLSIPHLFGSLVTSLASVKQASGDQQQQQESQADETDEQNKRAAAEREMYSIVSTSTNTSSDEPIDETIKRPAQITTTAASTAVAVSGQQQPESNATDETSHNPSHQKPARAQSKGSSHQQQQQQHQRRRSSSFMAINSVTSRVLHMNVASFSYVRDEQLISTKKHNQLNYHHFFTPKSSSNSKHAGPLRPETTKSSKLCQLVISVCDIENILNSCWLNERSCALLAYSSAIYVQCEILLPKSKSARLLSYPLRALNQSSSAAASSASSASSPFGSAASGRTHTVNFSTAISAQALERQQPSPHLATPICFEQLLGVADLSSSADTSLNDSGSVLSDLTASGQAAQVSGTETITSSTPMAATTAPPPPPVSTTRTATNWRHEPQADGKSIVIFNSVPKQIAHEQELAAASFVHQQETDLIQFDSVFVSPILAKSTIEDGYLRFRVHSQCKYVNESCLAELKLPLKQLLRSETRDNLGDANRTRLGAESNNSHQQKQADFILNNLLENLVTANTGSPLSTLIEQISTEEREAEQAADQRQQQQAQGEPTASVFGRLPWLMLTQHQQQPSEQELASSGSKKLKLSSSLNESLYRLGTNQTTTTTTTSPSSIYQQETTTNTTSSDTQLYMADQGHVNEGVSEWTVRQAAEQAEAEQHERLMEQNYCRSLMVSHWLNYLVAPSYECQLSDDSKGRVLLGLSYLPTSNRLIFNAHKATIDNSDDSFGVAATMKNLRLQSSTCYLLRFLMVVNGRVVKRKQTAVGRRPEWDSQEPITFDLASVSVAQPHFIVALVMRNATMHSCTGSLQNLRQQQQQRYPSVASGNCGAGYRRANQVAGAYSEPESGHPASSGLPAGHHHSGRGQLEPPGTSYNHAKRDLVIGHMVIGEEMWRELRLKPRKQIVRQFKIY